MKPFRVRSAAVRLRAAVSIVTLLALLVVPVTSFANQDEPTPPPSLPEAAVREQTAYRPDPVLEGIEPFTQAPITSTVTFEDAYGDATAVFGDLAGDTGEPNLLPEDVEVWLPGFCSGTDLCLVGDFNGDGRDDVASLYRDRPEPQRGDVMVALRSVRGFAPATKWADDFCVGQRTCKVGDFDGNGRDDLVSFTNDLAPAGQVRVALSTGSAFGPANLWSGFFCQIPGAICDVGDMDGNGRDDVVMFTHGAAPSSVWVGLSLGTPQFTPIGQWNGDFCRANETCAVGDVNGDTRDDLIAFVQYTITPTVKTSPVWVALSTGAGFAGGAIWSNFFCIAGEQCRVGDFDGDNRADLLAFVPATKAAWVSLSNGAGFTTSSVWHPDFCQPGNDCMVGDFDGDGRDDVIRFVKSFGGFYVALAKGSAASGFFLTPGNPAGRWHPDFCKGTEVCAIGDFNGDGRDDIARFVKNSVAGIGANDVFVSLSDGASFGPEQLWSGEFCQVNDQCKVGDFNHDGKDDLVAFRRDPAANGQVWVALSTGFGFLTWFPWSAGFCVGNEWCETGDFNGDGFDDVVTFLRNTYTNDPKVSYYGDVRVALNNRANQFVPTANLNWHDYFCAKDEQCGVGDFNGDGRDDIVSFVRSVGKVYVAVSTGGSFINASPWQGAKPFCIPGEVCDIGDFNGDGADDVVAFTRSAYVTPNPSSFGDVYVALSTRSGFTPSQLWNDLFCVGFETCGVGDFNGDLRDDAITFLKSTVGGERQGDVYVALARYGAGYYFSYIYDRFLFLPFVAR